VRTVRWIFLALSAFLFGAEANVGAAGTPWNVGLASGNGSEAQASNLPAAPVATATCSSGLPGSIVVGWAATPPAVAYTVYRSTSSGTSGFTVAASNVMTLTYTQSGLGVGSYWFAVAGSVGTNWTGPLSAPTPKRTITLVLCT
jgi:hypothetical protein